MTRPTTDQHSARKHQRQMIERVDRIEAAPSGSAQATRAAPLWRRVTAFAFDLFLIELTMKFLSGVLPAWTGVAGEHARLSTWLVALAYFAFLDSRLEGGQSIGKRLLDIVVVRPDGSYLSPPEALLRAAAATAPIFLNGHVLTGDSFMVPALLHLALFGVPLATLYLLALSNDTRQVLLHDLAVGTLVLRDEDRRVHAPLPPPARLSRGHAIAVGAMLFDSLAIPFILSWLAGRG